MKKLTLVLLLSCLILASCSDAEPLPDAQIESSEASAEQIALFSGYTVLFVFTIPAITASTLFVRQR